LFSKGEYESCAILGREATELFGFADKDSIAIAAAFVEIRLCLREGVMSPPGCVLKLNGLSKLS